MGRGVTRKWEKRQEDTSAIISAKKDLRRAAVTVAECPYCVEGWRYAESGGWVVRCPVCWQQYVDAFDYLRNLDGEFFVEDSMANFKPGNPGPWVALSQITEMRKSMCVLIPKGEQ